MPGILPLLGDSRSSGKNQQEELRLILHNLFQKIQENKHFSLYYETSIVLIPKQNKIILQKRKLQNINSYEYRQKCPQQNISK